MRLVLALIALAALPACSLFRPDAGDPIACTLEFRAYTVQVVDTEGRLVDGLTATARNLRTGETFTFEEDAGVYGDGRYLVATDAQQGQLSEAGDRVLFAASGDGQVAEAEFVFSGGPCHVEKASGPERIVAQPE